MARRRNDDTQAKTVTVEVSHDALLERIERLEDAFIEQTQINQRLLDLLTEKKDDTRGRTLAPPTRAQLSAQAFRARQGRAARRADMTLAEFIEAYGEVDRIPQDDGELDDD